MLIESLNGVSHMPIVIAVIGKGNTATRYLRINAFIETGDKTTEAIRHELDGKKTMTTIPVKTGMFLVKVIYGIHKGMPDYIDEIERNESLNQFIATFCSKVNRERWLKIWAKEQNIDTRKFPIDFLGSTIIGWDKHNRMTLKVEVSTIYGRDTTTALSPDMQKFAFDQTEKYFAWIADIFWLELKKLQEKEEMRQY